MIKEVFMKSSVLCLILVTILLGACSPSSDQRPLPASHPDRLKATLSLLLEEANIGNQHALRQKLETILPLAKVTRTLLRDSPRNETLTMRFEEMRRDALNELPAILIEAKTQGFNLIEITRVSPQSGSTNAPGDLSLLEQLTHRQGLYTARLMREGESKGLRLSAWLHLKDYGWISLLKLGELIERGSF